jgi:hypothetical protein
MLRKSKTLKWNACPCRQCHDRKRDKRLWRRIARRKEERAWLRDAKA